LSTFPPIPHPLASARTMVGQWGDTGTGDTQQTQGAGSIGGRSVCALPWPPRAVSRADNRRSGHGRFSPSSTQARAAGAPPI